MTFRVFGAPAEIRTPDTLLKRQVLCRLSYWGILAGMAGLEPTNEGVKVPCLTAWLHPYAVITVFQIFLIAAALI